MLIFVDMYVYTRSKNNVGICNLIQGPGFVDKMEIQEMDLENIHVIWMEEKKAGV